MAAFDGVGEDGFGDDVEVNAGGEATGEAGDFDAQVLEFVGKVKGGAVAFEGGLGAEDDFTDAAGLGAGEEGLGVDFAGADAVQGGEAAHEDVVDALVESGGFKGDDVAGLFNDHDHGLVAAGVGADGAGVGLGEVEADAAGFDVVLEVEYSVGEGFSFGWRLLEQVVCQTLSGSSADAWEAGEPGDELIHCGGVCAERHALILARVRAIDANFGPACGKLRNLNL